MSSIATPDPVIVERTRDAWQRYADELRDLSGAEYETAEREAVLASPVVAAAIEAFPDAELIGWNNVRSNQA